MALIVVTGRGGAGKTTTTANLSTFLAMREYRVLAVDGDLYLPNLGFHFALDTVKYTLHSLLKNPELDPEWAIYKHPQTGVHVMPGSTQLQDVLGISPKRLVDILERVKYRFGVVFVDSPTGIPFDTLPTFELANYQLIVVEIERSPIYSFEVMVKNEIEKLKALGERYNLNIGVILNKVRESEDIVDKIIEAVEEDLNVPVLGWIPFDNKVPESINLGVPVIKYYPNSDAAIAFRETGEVLEEWIFG
ncbi:ATPase [Thermococcus onnurineus NA1]|uniref:ATPase n=1 Tax=Thermococcus onnurineus (strain NA1) TaxID=523850 RepID=B6YTJ6_THEON|nr:MULTISPECIES: MinD/ParA family protein [Thermococcus]ACJ15883.1 ATPase [Thermococcus onnurineus NA1]NJE42398.1 MinD/ParA family protein [Thermococcus sp. GR6]NJE46381.1 MinD/ParA family protein [Thermococcus sp. GR7]NJE77700.1 MinD/ParA family protein [Thermococcus sp. GR4]NJF23739.1 MinD/ParA family protein [Thermococcus sp. GR5]